MIELIFGDQTIREGVLVSLDAKVLGEWYDPTNGRLHINALSPNKTTGTYFVGADGVLHELESVGHAFPCGKIFFSLIPKHDHQDSA